MVTKKRTFFWIPAILCVSLLSDSLSAMEKKEGMEIAISNKTLSFAQDADTHIDPICREDFAKDKWPELFTVHKVQGVSHSFHTKCIHEWVIEKGHLTCPTCRLPISPEQAMRIDLMHTFPKTIVDELSDSNQLALRNYIKAKGKDTVVRRTEKNKKVLESAAQLRQSFASHENERIELRRELARYKKGFCAIVTSAAALVGINVFVFYMHFSKYTS